MSKSSKMSKKNKSAKNVKNKKLAVKMKKKNKINLKNKNVIKSNLNENQVTDNTKSKKLKWKDLPLRERMLQKLASSRFRYLNEQLYTKTSQDAVNLFKIDPEAFDAYHKGYSQQVKQWPINPIDTIIKWLSKKPSDLIVADFGCGEAKLAASVRQKVHSFDLVALNSNVTVCDMTNCPLENASVDIAIYCLSLMGTNLQDYFFEANRVLKKGGILKIAEVESRFDNVDNFIEGVEEFGFQLTTKDYNHKLFYFFEFVKKEVRKHKKKLPTISLHPCLYKKR